METPDGYTTMFQLPDGTWVEIPMRLAMDIVGSEHSPVHQAAAVKKAKQWAAAFSKR